MGMILGAISIAVLGAVLYFAFYDRTAPATTGSTRTSTERTLPQTTTPPSNTTTTPTTPAPPPATK